MENGPVEYDAALLDDARSVIMKLAKERFAKAKIVRIEFKEDEIDGSHVLFTDLYYEGEGKGPTGREKFTFTGYLIPRLAKIGINAHPVLSYAFEGDLVAA